MIIEKFPIPSNQYMCFAFYQALNRFAELNGFKPMPLTKNIDNRLNFMKRIGIRGDLTDRGIRFSATGSLRAEDLLNAHKERARGILPTLKGITLTQDQKITVTCAENTAGHLTWGVALSLYRIAWPNYEVELAL